MDLAAGVLGERRPLSSGHFHSQVAELDLSAGDLQGPQPRRAVVAEQVGAVEVLVGCSGVGAMSGEERLANIKRLTTSQVVENPLKRQTAGAAFRGRGTPACLS